MSQPASQTGPVGLATDVIRAANHVRIHLERTVLRPVGLTWTTFDVLQTVCAAGRIDSTSTMVAVGIAKGTLSATVSTLVRRGLLQRDRHVADRRLIDLVPTGAGLQLAPRIQESIAMEEAWLTHHGHLDAVSLAVEVRALVTPLRLPNRRGVPPVRQPTTDECVPSRPAQDQICVTR